MFYDIFMFFIKKIKSKIKNKKKDLKRKKSYKTNNIEVKNRKTLDYVSKTNTILDVQIQKEQIAIINKENKIKIKKRIILKSLKKMAIKLKNFEVVLEEVGMDNLSDRFSNEIKQCDLYYRVINSLEYDKPYFPSFLNMVKEYLISMNELIKDFREL